MPRSALIIFCIKQACPFKQVKILHLPFDPEPMPKGMVTAGRRPRRMLQVPGGLLPAACDPAPLPWHSLRYIVIAASSTLSFSAV
jgi:hypothetical protein